VKLVHIEAIGRSARIFKEMANKNNGINVSQPQTPIFKGENYGFGSIKMKTLFLPQELWDLVENVYTELAEAKLLLA